MKLNAKGWEAYKRMEKKYNEELDRIRKELKDPEYTEGWCIIDNSDACPSVQDYLELLVFGDMEDALWVLIEGFKYDSDDAVYVYGVRWKDFARLLLPYYDLDDDDKEYLAKHGIIKNDAGSFLTDDEKMHDFFRISKEEFLFSYSYLTEEDYDLTVKEIKEWLKKVEEE